MSHLAHWTRMVPGARVMHRNPALSWHGTVGRAPGGFAWTWIDHPFGGWACIFVEWDHAPRGQWHLAASLAEEREWTEDWRGSR